MGLLNQKCPVIDRERTWIEDSLDWLRSQFGAGPLAAQVVLPTSKYFPPPFSGSDDEVRVLVAKVAGYMHARTDVSVEFSDDFDHARELQRGIHGAGSISGAAGQYVRARGGRPAITIDRASTRQPARLLAVIAHELGHVRLLGEGRVASDRGDGEPLTDLATVYLGMGIFTANASFEFSQTANSQSYSWQAQRLGYMTEKMFGYSLACYAVMRGQPDPPWAKYLDTNPRVYMKHSLRYLRHAAPGTEPSTTSATAQ
jgi:hypothetical protein